MEEYEKWSTEDTAKMEALSKERNDFVAELNKG